MALFAIGDVQGCRHSLERLLARISLDARRDRLWFVGDLVNRGPDSLGALRLVRSLGPRVVLGNHDLHLLAVAVGARPLKASDTFMDVLGAPDRDELLAWLAEQPLVVRDDASGWLMVHAGLLPAWDADAATDLSVEAGRLLRSRYRDRDFMARVYGDRPERWDDGLASMDRTRVVVNAMTRMRFCDSLGRMALDYTGPPGSQPPQFRPWFELWPHRSHRVVFGHWSALGAGRHGTTVSTDSGCVWGNRLTAVRLEPEPVEFFSVGCEPAPESSQTKYSL